MRIFCNITHDDIEHIVTEIKYAHVDKDNSWLYIETTDDDTIIVTGLTREQAIEALKTLLTTGQLDMTDHVAYLNEDPPDDDDEEENNSPSEPKTNRGFGIFNRDPWNRH